MVRRLVAVLTVMFAMLATASAIAVAAPAPYPGGGGASASVSASQVATGHSVTFAGRGFAPSSAVSIAVNRQPYGTTTANASGGFSMQVTLTTVGANSLTATGTAADGSPVTVQATVTVVQTTSAGLPFTGSSLLLPGTVIGIALLAGGALLLTAGRKRRAHVSI